MRGAAGDLLAHPRVRDYLVTPGGAHAYLLKLPWRPTHTRLYGWHASAARALYGEKTPRGLCSGAAARALGSRVEADLERLWRAADAGAAAAGARPHPYAAAAMERVAALGLRLAYSQVPIFDERARCTSQVDFIGTGPGGSERTLIELKTGAGGLAALAPGAVMRGGPVLRALPDSAGMRHLLQLFFYQQTLARHYDYPTQRALVMHTGARGVSCLSVRADLEPRVLAAGGTLDALWREIVDALARAAPSSTPRRRRRRR